MDPTSGDCYTWSNYRGTIDVYKFSDTFLVIKFSYQAQLQVSAHIMVLIANIVAFKPAESGLNAPRLSDVCSVGIFPTMSMGWNLIGL